MQFFDTAKLFLESIGRSDEIEHYLQRFRATKGEFFAVIVPDSQVCQFEADQLVLQLGSLSKLGLTVLLLLTGTSELYSKQITDRLEAAGVRSDSIQPLVSNRNLIQSLTDLIGNRIGRVHFLRSAGILMNQKEPVAVCTAASEVDSKDQPVAVIAFDLLSKRPDLHISVCSPANLLKEIFTVKGAGTIFRHEVVIEHTVELSAHQKIKINQLIEQSFGRRLKDAGFFDHVSDVFFEKDFSAAIVLEKHRYGYYLSKFAVDVDARGSGVAAALWQTVSANRHPLFWRSRRTNSIHRWYEKIADGFHRSADWTIYWKGADISHLPLIIEYVASRPSDFDGG